MYCRTCGKENPEGTTECSNCGCNPTEGNMYCPACGHFCLPGDTQCVNCGQSLAESPTLSKTIVNEVPPVPPIQNEVPPIQNEVPPIPEPISPEPEPTVQVAQPVPEMTQPQSDPAKKYCRNCGLIIDAASLRCPYCDAVANAGSQYCPKCGMTTSPQDATCAYCGEKFVVAPDLSETKATPQTPPQPQQQQYRQPQPGPTVPPYIQSAPPAHQQTSYRNTDYSRANGMPTAKGNCSFLVTLLLCLFLGYLGIHRFYTKQWVVGILQFLTGGGCGIWWLIDIILIVAGSYRDGDGNPLDRDM